MDMNSGTIVRLSTLATLLLIVGFVLGATGNSEEPSQEFKGRIAVKGSEPFTQIVLVTGEGDYALVGDIAEKLSCYQGTVVKLSGEVVAEAVGPGFPAKVQVSRIVQTY